MKKDLVIGLGVGIPVVILMIAIGGGGHSDFELEEEYEKPIIEEQKQVASTFQSPSQTFQSTTSQSIASLCDPSYPDICIAPYPPDLDCGEISFNNFRVYQPDPHGFDRDKDGIGCES